MPRSSYLCAIICGCQVEMNANHIEIWISFQALVTFARTYSYYVNKCHRQEYKIDIHRDSVFKACYISHIRMLFLGTVEMATLPDSRRRYHSIRPFEFDIHILATCQFQVNRVESFIIDFFFAVELLPS